jgi:integrase
MEYQILKMYQFSCFCGLRFSDAMTLIWKDIDFENSIIRKTIIKTKTDVITPLFPMARDILMEWSKNGALLNIDTRVSIIMRSRPLIKRSVNTQNLQGLISISPTIQAVILSRPYL